MPSDDFLGRVKAVAPDDQRGTLPEGPWVSCAMFWLADGMESTTVLATTGHLVFLGPASTAARFTRTTSTGE